MDNIFGIDVSKWQKNFDFNKARSEGVRFAIIKASQSLFKDGEFENHYKKAKANGILAGAYHYLVAASKEEAKVHAEYMIENCLKGKTFEYPIFADVEDSVLKYLSKKAVDEIIITFCNTLEKAGYWAGFYCNYDFYMNHCNGGELSDRYSLWLASWGNTPPAECQIWQFGGETNVLRTSKVAGVVCDQNYSFRDFPNLIKAKGLNGTKANSTENKNESESAVQNLCVGDKVRLRPDAFIYETDKRFASWVYKTDLYIREIKGHRAVVSTAMMGALTGAVDVKYLFKLI